MRDSLNHYTERVGPILDSLKPPYLGTQQEISLLDEATSLRISQEDAERYLILLCRRKGIEIEHFLERDFRLRVQAALGDRFLDERERKLLLGQGHELFASAPDPDGIAKGIIDREVKATRALSEQDLQKDLKERLAGRRKLARRDWEAIRNQVTQAAEKAGVDMEENELGELYDQLLVDSPVKIQDGAAPLVMFLWTALVAVLTYVGLRYFLL